MKKDISDIFIMHLHKLLIYLVILVIIPNSLCASRQQGNYLFMHFISTILSLTILRFYLFFLQTVA